MKKQLALIIISMLAVMPAGAKTINNTICTDTANNNINSSCCENNIFENNCLHDGCSDFWNYPFNYDCSNGFYSDCFGESSCLPQFPQRPDFPQGPQIPEMPEVPDKPSLPQEPSIPQEPSLPQEPENDNTQNDSSVSDSEILTLLNLVNNERNKNGIASLTYDETLELCAYVRSKEIKTLFSHTRPSGESCFTVLDEFGYKYSTAGENIAYGQQTAQEVFTAWMNSQGHRENILSPSFTRIGMGRYDSGNIYWAQMFASK